MAEITQKKIAEKKIAELRELEGQACIMYHLTTEDITSLLDALDAKDARIDELVQHNLTSSDEIVAMTEKSIKQQAEIEKLRKEKYDFALEIYNLVLVCRISAPEACPICGESCECKQDCLLSKMYYAAAEIVNAPKGGE